ncbi:DUF732 domain-containing protein [Modestobacter sp. VKM Ac-2984]|uniref:DUF732 domain-containing protein n=1 Tax=Modestobacter sp. VKM Ac-2984 TaxID=3004138 RepID=UPI0022AA81FD|nr:DUF732 domain-containing protein [Modestobacter sp. VKM Ac-2984]MCZ2818013.1 DUF732 domain-containing protein [Modestobacter sp. VKM Ac-2984]
MPRTVATTGLLLAALLTAGCADTSSPEPEAAPRASEAAPATTEPPAEPFLAPGYPTPADADSAFVSEVAALDGVRAFLTRDPFILPTDLTAASAGIARLGRGVCASYTGANIDSVAGELLTTYEVDNTVDPMTLDPIDAAAFVVAAVGVYCPQKLVDLGQGAAMTDGVEVQPVAPQCPTELPVTVTASPITLTGESNVERYGDLGEDNDLVYGDTDGMYDGDWTYTITNTSDYDVLVMLEEQVASPRYTTEWHAPEGDLGPSPHAPFYVPAHGTATGTGNISGVYAWQSAAYRVATGLPISCQVTLQ